MAEAIATPRINSSYLDSFTNQTVRMIGKVVQLRGEQAIIDAGGNITAHLTRVSRSRVLVASASPPVHFLGCFIPPHMHESRVHYLEVSLLRTDGLNVQTWSMVGSYITFHPICLQSV